MRKFTLILSLLVAFVTTAMAQITVGSVYSIQNKNTGNAISQDDNLKLATVAANTADNAQLWIVEEGSVEGTYMFRNLNSGSYAQFVEETYTHWYTDYATANFYVGEMSAATADAAAYHYISYSAISDITTASYSVMHQSNGYVVRWEQTNNSSQWAFIEVENADIATISEDWKNMQTIKDIAVAEVESLSQLDVIFPASTDYVDRIEAITATSTDIADLATANSEIKAIVAEYKQLADGKDVKFTNSHTDVRAGLQITAVGDNAYGSNNGADNSIWTLKIQDDGNFKLYNFIANKYLNTPGTAALTDESGAANYKFIVVDTNKTALVDTNNKMLHQANYWGPNNYDLLSWYDLNDAGSLWNLTENEIVITRELHELANSAKTSLPYAIQQAYGLVTDASNYYSNYKSDAEGSYAALIDNDITSYFHSSYADADIAEDISAHYIQAEFSQAVDEFYFYMAPRSQNGNNRPVTIEVSGSNDNNDYTKITDVTTSLDASLTPYLSAKIGTEGTNYKYIRLTVNSTNNSTKFFTLSELYFFPATSDVTSLVDAYKNLSTTSITSNDYVTYANTLINAEATLALANVKKEIAALLTANENNHAEIPALGQYTTSAYNALNDAYNSTDATEESLEAAIATFKVAKNSPVFTINGVISYAAGKSIYEDEGNTNGKGNDLYFKTTNKYDKTMWWILDQASTNIAVVDEIGIANYATRNGFWGASSIKITETSDTNTEDGIFLFYTKGNDTPIHAQNDYQLITRWSSDTSDSGSAWTFTHLGNTYDLDQLTDEKISALAALQTAYNAKAPFADAVIGEGLGEYTGDKNAITTALTAAEAIGAKTLTEQAALSIDEINAATTALNNANALTINLPEEGKYYRIKGACDATLANYYITGNTNADGGRIACAANADASTIFYYADGKLLAYNSGLYIGLNASDWTFSTADGSKAASAITFAGSPRVVGAYTVKSADRYLHYTVYNNTVEVNRCMNDTDANHDWYLEEVTELPVTVSIGYATLYAPVALEVPANVTAHTVTINGEWATLSEALEVIPANTGVVLKAENDTYNFAITTAEEFSGENDLNGTIARTLITKNENTAYYILGYANETAGFYNPVNGDDTTTFYNGGHKAYIAVEGASQSSSVRFGEGTTGVENVTIENGVETIFDLTGRKIESVTAPGIYIINGKKVLVK